MDEVSLLLVDHDSQALQRCRQILGERVAEIAVAESGTTALFFLSQRSFRAMFVELELPDRSCLGLIWEARRLHPDLRCVILASRATLEASIDALRSGVCDLVLKPISRIAILSALDRALGSNTPRIISTIAPQPPCAAPETVAVPLEGSLKEIERRLVQAVIHRHDGNKTAAARALGMHRKTLYRMLQK